MNNIIYDKVLGCLLGCAIGDAMGAVTENLTFDQIREKYGNQVALETDVPEALAAAMGNHVFIVKARTQEEIFEMIRYILKREDGTDWMQ